MAYESTMDRDAAAEILRRVSGPVWVLTHAKPDGDAVGSVLALTLTLQRMGVTATGILCPPVPAYVQALPGVGGLCVDDGGLALPDAPALVVVCDTGAVKQLGEGYRLIEPYLDRTLVIDHHLSGDLSASDFLVDATQASCAQIVADVIDRLDPEPALDVCTAIYAGLATDTGWFRFSNTDPNTFRRAADLIERGVNHAALYEAIEQQQPVEKLGLMGRALASLVFTEGRRAAVMSLTRDDFSATGASPEHTEGLVNLPLMVASVRAAVLVTESTPTADGARACRLSFRSKPEAVGPIDVSALANRFGGGGHARAAGGGFDGTPEAAVGAVIEALDGVMAGPGVV